MGRPHLRAARTATYWASSKKVTTAAGGSRLHCPASFRTASQRQSPGGKPRRMFAICNNLGLLPDQFFPKESGKNYAPSPYLEYLKEHRDDFTVFSGVSHPDVDGGHPADNCFLTAAPHPGSGGFRNTISLDQYIGERIGTLTRFPSITLSVNTRTRSLSWTGTGVELRDGQELWFDSKGEVRWGPGRKDGPGGESGSPRNAARPIPSRPAAALIGLFGTFSLPSAM